MASKITFANERIWLVVFAAIVFLILMDASLARTFQFTSHSAYESMVTYTLMVFFYSIGQYLISVYIKRKTIKISQKLRRVFKILLRTIVFAQYLSIIIVITVLIQLLINSRYNTFLLEFSVWLNYVQAIFLTLLLFYYFIVWFKNTRGYSILPYAVSVILLTVNVSFVFLYAQDMLSNLPSEIRPHRPYILPTPNSTLVDGIRVSSLLSYIGMWVATSFQLRNHVEKLGKVMYWVLISLPLIYFLLQFQPALLQSISSYFHQDIIFNILYTLFFSAAKPIGGILFGTAFWILGIKTKNVTLKSFMILTAYGLVIFFASNQAIILTYGIYPPFGLITISFLGAGAYLLFVGIYSSSISVAQDISLNKMLKQQLTKFGFIENIGSGERARIETKIANRAVNLGKKMEDLSGLPTSWEEQDIHDYIKLYYQEIRKKPKRDSS